MAQIKHSELATRLIVEGAIGMFRGDISGQLPVKPEVLSDREAQDLGLPPDGTTLYYPLGEKGVYFDSAGSRMVAWYSGADAERAPAVFETELKRRYPEAKQVIDADHPTASDMRMRAYDVKIGEGLLATIEVSYSKPGARPPKFSAQIVGMAIKN